MTPSLWRMAAFHLFGICDLFGIWVLEFGVSLRLRPAPAASAHDAARHNLIAPADHCLQA